MGTSLLLLPVSSHTFVHLHPWGHPLLAFVLIRSILLAAALLDLPLGVNACCRIMLQGHFVPNMLKRVEGLGTPTHQAIFCHQLDPLGRMEGSDSAHAVPLCPTMAAFGIFHFLEHLFGVEWLHACGQLFI